MGDLRFQNIGSMTRGAHANLCCCNILYQTLYPFKFAVQTKDTQQGPYQRKGKLIIQGAHHLPKKNRRSQINLIRPTKHRQPPHRPNEEHPYNPELIPELGKALVPQRDLSLNRTAQWTSVIRFPTNPGKLGRNLGHIRGLKVYPMI